MIFHVLLSLTLAGVASSDAAFDVETPLLAVEEHANLEYGGRNESSLPLFPRDFALLQKAIETIDDEVCRSQCQLILGSLRNLTSWAAKFYDASGKFPDGVLAGSVYQLGNFDECLKIGFNDDTPRGVRGQYCLGELDVKVPESYLEKQGSLWESFKEAKERYEESIDRLYWGICVPASCASQDVQDVVRKILAVALSESGLKASARIPERSCFKNDSFTVSTLDIIYMCIIFSLISVICVATVFDVVYLRKNGETHGKLAQILTAFSLPSNLRKLFGPAHKDELQLTCISGIKSISMIVIIIGHTLIFVFAGPVLNKDFIQQAARKVENSVFINSPLLVETFLLLSSFLFCRILLRELDKRKSINLIFVYALRYIRLTPAYLIIVGFYITWLTKLDSGPLWSRMILEQERCLSSWWANILYINNYINTDKLCMFQSWYLSVDTQLFVLAPIVIYPLWKWRRLGECLLAGVTVISIIIPFVVTFVNQADPTLMIYAAEIQDISANAYFKTSYIKTHMRAAPYCIGLVYGYIAYRIHASDYKLSKILVRVGWIFGTLSLVLSMCSVSVFYGPRKHFTPLEAALYSSLHRTFWSIGTGWVLIACITDNSGIVKKILTLRPFISLSRLTYCMYLVNGLIELHGLSTIRSPSYLSVYRLLTIVISHLVLTILGAIVLSVTFESPILGIERIFLRNEKRTSQEKCTSQTNTPGSYVCKE